MNDEEKAILHGAQGPWKAKPGHLFIFTAIIFLIVVAFSAGAAAQKKSAQKIDNAECLACHTPDGGLTKEVNGKQVSLAVDDGKFKASIHGSMFACVDCHSDIKAVPHENTPAKPQCATCHADEVNKYNHGFHAQAVKNGNSNAASCQDCHGNVHEILPASDPASKVHRSNIPATCGACHGQKFVMEKAGLSATPFIDYQQSVHGQSIAKEGDNSKAAVCTDCHGTHEILSAGNPKSPIFKFNVPDTCAKCHGDVEKEYMGSIHGQAIKRGNWQSPVCTDCHGIHSIKAPSDPASSVSSQAVARTTCGRCHESVRLAAEFGVASGRESTYLASYHGLASQVGSNVVANCASCHGVHNILPSSDPKSTINKANLAQTCGKCHPGANQNFIKGKIHVDAPLSADVGSIAVRWTRRFYMIMIFAVIGSMLLHNLILWRRKAKLHREGSRRIVVRMDPKQRYQHLALLLSFITLVLTGFALKYPDSWLADLFVNESVRSILHRVGAVVLIAVSAYHAVYVLTDKEGRRLFLDMLPVPKDVTDIIQNLRYHLGLSPEKPKFARFNYAEKAEYLALVWGMFVMAATGLSLWFKVQVGDVFPRWWLDVATAVHFYEAVLATLAIVVWHLYMVIFDPDTYPMNWSWYDGKMSVEHYQEEHELDGDTILRSVEAAAIGKTTPAPGREKVKEEETVAHK
jgi:cytochrome b subunit of formate dehydrogenase